LHTDFQGKSQNQKPYNVWINTEIMEREGEKPKLCFVIAPIGSKESETRKRSDKVLKHIIKPIAEKCCYKVIRADKISEPGIITTQIIQHLLDDDLVIADLTGKNPNVFYELAIRHTVRKPVVQIIKYDESIPFDVSTTRTIKLNLQDLDSVAECKEELEKQIHSVEKDPEKVDSPISVAVDLKALRESENPLEKSTVEIISMLQSIQSSISELHYETGERFREIFRSADKNVFIRERPMLLELEGINIEEDKVHVDIKAGETAISFIYGIDIENKRVFPFPQIIEIREGDTMLSSSLLKAVFEKAKLAIKQTDFE
jgi:hypothetical protein